MMIIEPGATYKSKDGANRKVLSFEDDMVEFVFEGQEDQEPSHLTEEHFRNVVTKPIRGASLTEGDEAFPALSKT